jgi:hypothetical protein
MHVVLRRYRVRFGSIELMPRYAHETLLPRLRQVPGFAGYYMVNGGDGLVASIGLFETPAAAAAGDQLVAGWFRGDWPAFRAVPPDLTSGEVMVAEQPHREAGSTSEGRPRVERRTGVERRAFGERRRRAERRASAVREPEAQTV